MITKANIEKLYERSLTYPNEDRFFFVDAALDLAEKLLQERDEALRKFEAAREVAIGYAISDYETKSHTKEMCIKDVDAEIKRRLSETKE